MALTTIKTYRELEPAARANFATTSRLFSCLVTESLVQALYFELEGFEITGFAVILPDSASSSKSDFASADILAVFPLRHVPVFKHDAGPGPGKDIGLLDPMDMAPIVLELAERPEENHLDLCSEILHKIQSNGLTVPSKKYLATSKSPLPLWQKYAASQNIQEHLRKEISDELESSVKWQKYSFEHPPKAPTFESSSIEWEQSIVEGHPTHPMHKTRMFLPPIRDMAPGEYDLYHSRTRLVALPRSSLKITYDFDHYTKPILEAASKNAGKPLEVPKNFVIVPVHELQVAHIEDKFKEAIIYDPEFSVPHLAQQSVRSVILPEVLDRTHLKLGVGIKLTSAVRTISPASAYLGPRFSAEVEPVLTMDRNILTVARELASVVHVNPDPEIAKHCAVIVREAHELKSHDKDERMIVCTALVETGHAGEGGDVAPVIRVFELDTEEKRVQWLDSFVKLFLEAFLPSVLHNGVAFEAHPQNCIARFDAKTKQLKGFIVRDFGGIRVHPPTLLATTGVALDFLEGHSIIALDLDDVYTRMYHTFIHNHFQQLIRVLGLHYNGIGWAIVRKHLTAMIPVDHSLHEAWLSEDKKTFPGKCFMRMRMQGMYRFHLHGPFPNLILYRGVTVD